MAWLPAGWLIAALLATLPAQAAEERRFATLDLGETAKLIGSWGYDVRAYYADDGYPEIIVPMHGTDVLVEFYDCTGDKRLRCGELELSAAFDVFDRLSLEQLNDWNGRWRFHAAYKAGNSAYLRLDILLEGGEAESGLREHFAIFDAAVADFSTLAASAGDQAPDASEPPPPASQE